MRFWIRNSGIQQSGKLGLAAVTLSGGKCGGDNAFVAASECLKVR